MTPIEDFATVEDARAYSVTTMERIEGPIRKTAVETVNIFNGTRDRLASFVPNPALTSEQQITATQLASMIVKALDNLFSVDFYINLAEPQVLGAYQGALAYGVLTQAEYDGILLAGEQILTPYADITEYEFARVKGLIPTKVKSSGIEQLLQGRLVITTNIDTLEHSPRVLYTNPRTGRKDQVSIFRSVITAGIYEARIPNEYQNEVLEVEDFFGAIT